MKTDSPAEIADPGTFNPPFFLKSPTLQSMLASAKLRLPRHSQLIKYSKERILTVTGGVRIQGFYSPQPDSGKKGLAILLHGWEGSVNSTYIRCTGEALFQKHFNVFRLNFRDHGDTHHLNHDPFRSDRLNEVFEAIDQMAAQHSGQPVFLAGFSLGGNFALRVARKCVETPIQNLKLVVGISPLMDPAKSTEVIDRIPWMRRYFLKKWFRSMDKKEKAFPDDFDFSEAKSLPSCMAITELLIKEQSPYPNVTEYFNTYTLKPDFFDKLTVPVLIIAAKDDPAIPVEDILALRENPLLYRSVTGHGGHCGFIENIKLESWLNHRLPALFDPKEEKRES
ncbi:MAG: alpha/beta fold hydrolase [Acidobacteria bacterium]|nr:alpha/beta fold hydrolase [Acidobacteriota bacterium]